MQGFFSRECQHLAVLGPMRLDSTGGNGTYTSRSWIVAGYGENVPIPDIRRPN
jgi:hypothetical protein